MKADGMEGILRRYKLQFRLRNSSDEESSTICGSAHILPTGLEGTLKLVPMARLLIGARIAKGNTRMPPLT